MTRAWLLGALIGGGCSSPDRDAPAQTAGARETMAVQPTKEIGGESTVSGWLITPRAEGLITRHTSEADIRRTRGDTVVAATRIQLGEGETAPGTVLYPSDSVRRLEILWQDSVNRRKPARLILRGKQSAWQVGRGISLGTSLQELERMNGGPFTLAGFGWDYGGVITDWNKGALDTLLGGVTLYLDPGPAQHESAPYSQVLGDRDYSSSLPAMQQLSPRVAQIFVDFE